MSQVHGARVVEVADAGPGLVDLTAERADALITDRRGVALAVRVADCVPVLLADAAAGLIGAAHAGRAGVLAGVVPATVNALRARGATRLTAWIGPHICASCYEVPDAMARDFADVTGVPPARTHWHTLGIDLGAAVGSQLDAAGVPFVSHEACTRESSTLWSYRRDGDRAGRFVGAVWLAAARGAGS